MSLVGSKNAFKSSNPQKNIILSYPPFFSAVESLKGGLDISNTKPGIE